MAADDEELDEALETLARKSDVYVVAYRRGGKFQPQLGGQMDVAGGPVEHLKAIGILLKAVVASSNIGAKQAAQIAHNAAVNSAWQTEGGVE